MEALGHWRDAAVILLVFEAFIMGLVPLAIAYFLARGAHWLVKHTRPAFAWVRGYVTIAEGYIEKSMDKAASPFIAWQGLWAGLGGGTAALGRLILGKRRERL